MRIRALLFVVLLASAGVEGGQSGVPQKAACSAWVLATAREMKTIKVGMTRADLLKVFEPQGGLSTRNHATFVSRACRYFKVDVEFSGSSIPRETNVIVKISKPYVDDQLIID